MLLFIMTGYMWLFFQVVIPKVIITKDIIARYIHKWVNKIIMYHPNHYRPQSNVGYIIVKEINILFMMIITIL